MVNSKFVAYVSALCMYVLSFKCLDCVHMYVCMFCLSRLFPQKIVLRHQIMRMSRPQRTTDCLVHKNVTLSCCLIFGCMGGLHHVAERAHFPSLHYLNIHKMLQRFVDCTFLNLVCVQKCYLPLSSPMHARPRHGPWKRLWMAKPCKGKTRVPDAIWDKPAKGDNPDRKS